MKAVIIGAGIGGLSTAAFLLKNGIHTTVLEKKRLHRWTSSYVE